MEIIELEETVSTNTWVSANKATLTSPVLVYAISQTAGRGQRGNSWESQPQKNLTASIYLQGTKVPPCGQFLISEITALSIIDLILSMGVEAKVKWPNDIYVGDKKICGILIENSILANEITDSVIGLGLNLNQEFFISDAPNPVSLKNITGKNYKIADVALNFSKIFEKRLGMLDRPEEIHQEYIKKLWRGNGAYYPFRDRKSESVFKARITDIARDGYLILSSENGNTHQYAFKEVEFIL